MVVNIAKATPTISRPLVYNEQKVGRDVATLLGGFNVDGMTPSEIAATFQRYESRNISTQNLAFHMSINPTERDNMNADDIVRFACRMMEGLGYGKQPFVIYRHNDIYREHYHVVSIRTNLDGKKISDYMEGRRCAQLMKDLQKEFGYEIGNKSPKKTYGPIQVFDPQNGAIIDQMDSIFKECLKYHFTSVEQFRMILQRAHIEAKIDPGSKSLFVLQGSDLKMRPCTGKILESDAGMKWYDSYQARAMECVDLMGVMKRERERIASCARGPLRDAKSELHFINMLRKNGIDAKFERNPRTNQITGGNFVDHVSKCAFRLSEIGNDLTLERLQEADRNWHHDDSSQQSRAENLAGQLLLGLVSGGGGRSRGHDTKDETDLEKKERLKQQKL